MRVNFKSPAQLESLINDYFVNWAKANKRGFMMLTLSNLAISTGLDVEEFKDLLSNPKYKKPVFSAISRVEKILARLTLTKDEYIEDIMLELVTNFGWIPLDDEDRKLIKKHLN